MAHFVVFIAKKRKTATRGSPTFRDNLHLLILSGRVITYGSETSPSESSPKNR